MVQLMAVEAVIQDQEVQITIGEIIASVKTKIIAKSSFKTITKTKIGLSRNQIMLVKISKITTGRRNWSSNRSSKIVSFKRQLMEMIWLILLVWLRVTILFRELQIKLKKTTVCKTKGQKMLRPKKSFQILLRTKAFLQRKK